jgi:hypothetical protein
MVRLIRSIFAEEQKRMRLVVVRDRFEPQEMGLAWLIACQGCRNVNGEYYDDVRRSSHFFPIASWALIETVINFVTRTRHQCSADVGRAVVRNELYRTVHK